MADILSTDSIAPSKRFAFWQKVLTDKFVALDCEPTSDTRFRGHIGYLDVNDVSFMHVHGAMYRVTRGSTQILQDRASKVVITLQLKGRCRLEQDGRSITLEPGDITLCDSTRPYCAEVDEPFEAVSMCLPRDKWTRRQGQTEQLTARAIKPATASGAIVCRFVHDLFTTLEQLDPIVIERYVDNGLNMIHGALSDQLIDCDSFHNGSKTTLLYRAKALINESIHNCDLDREMIASGLGISIRYLHDIFHSEHITVCEWIWQQRLELCRQALCDPHSAGKSISQIAYDCGFSDISHFSRRFKRAYRLSPSEYRKKDPHAMECK